MSFFEKSIIGLFLPENQANTSDRAPAQGSIQAICGRYGPTNTVVILSHHPEKSTEQIIKEEFFAIIFAESPENPREFPTIPRNSIPGASGREKLTRFGAYCKIR
jgi:hypothetical protein